MPILVTVLCLLGTYSTAEASQGHISYEPLTQGSALMNFRSSRHVHISGHKECLEQHSGNSGLSGIDAKMDEEDDHLLIDGLPGQPQTAVTFKQFAGYINVDQSSQRSLFYYFVESTSGSSTKPLILWLNGGPGCSSVGIGAFTEIGPFGVYPDGETLYSRDFSWNKEANVLFLESPADAGFSYSNTADGCSSFGDKRTAEDTYAFLIKWLERYPMFQGRDFYLAGENYAGHYIPQLADLILHNFNGPKDLIPIVNLKGIIVGNGVLDDLSDSRGVIDFAFYRVLTSIETHHDSLRSCAKGGIHENEKCFQAYQRLLAQIGPINYFNLYSAVCKPSFLNVTGGPCQLFFVENYLNLAQVQAAMNIKSAGLPIPWSPCSESISQQWSDSPSSMIPTYNRIMGQGLRILIYSGDLDACVPRFGSEYALAAMNLKVIKARQGWWMPDTQLVAGQKVVYEGLTYATVRGAGHEVSYSHPDKLYALMKDFINNQ